MNISPCYTARWFNRFEQFVLALNEEVHSIQSLNIPKILCKHFQKNGQSPSTVVLGVWFGVVTILLDTSALQLRIEVLKAISLCLVLLSRYSGLYVCEIISTTLHSSVNLFIRQLYGFLRCLYVVLINVFPSPSVLRKGLAIGLFKFAISNEQVQSRK